MNKIFIFALIFLSGCTAIKPPAECEGTLRKVNPETALNTIACKGNVA